MKKIVSTLAILILCIGTTAKAQSLRTLFTEMPDTLLPLLTTNNRMDLIDFRDAGMNTPVTNRLDGKSRITALTDNYLHLTVSQSSSMQMKLLPTTSGDTLICIINTACAEACDSRIRFFDKKWKQKEPTLYFTKPSIKEFFIESDTVEKALDIADIYLVELNISAASDSLSARYTMPQYMNREDSSTVAPQLRQLHYRWNGNRYER